MKYNLSAPLGELLALAQSAFGGVGFETVTLGSGPLQVAQITDMPAYLDKLVDKAQSGKQVQLPLWSKLWPACMVLTMFLERFPFKKGARILEIGAGVGVTGLALARLGFQVTLTDIEDNALLFSRINVLKNGVEENVRVLKADFTKDDLGERFDSIIGCEVLFRESFYEPLTAFVERHLEPGGEAFLAARARNDRKAFFELAKERFKVMRKDVPYKDTESGSEEVVNLYRLGAK